MGDLWCQLLPRNPRDLATLNAQTERKMALEDVVGYETMLRVTPRDAELHGDVALIGQPQRAADHFRAS
jgi:hypothetical protein